MALRLVERLDRLSRCPGGGGGGGDARRVVSVARQGSFLRDAASAAELAGTRTRMGYNPMLEDFANVSVLSTEPTAPDRS